MNQNGHKLFNKSLSDIAQVKEGRLQILDKIALEIYKSKSAHLEVVNVVFVCTHNSRRSQMAQLLLQLFLDEVGITEISVYSCGTEKTNLPTPLLALIDQQGLEYKKQAAGGILVENKYCLFSKTYDDETLPTHSIAIMVCDSANESCPFVPSFHQRISLEYVDPKISDNTPHQDKTYQKCWNKIAAEMAYLALKLDELVGKN